MAFYKNIDSLCKWGIGTWIIEGPQFCITWAHLNPPSYWCLQKRISSIIFWMCIEGLHNILENNFKILTTLLKCIYKFKYLIFHNNRMSKLLWKPWISYRIEEPLEHCMSIQAKTFCEESWFSKDFSSKWFDIIRLNFIYLNKSW
jgi:hypothetical protein